MKPNYDTTLARIAGNIAAGLLGHCMSVTHDATRREIAETAVDLAERIVERVKARAVQEAVVTLTPGRCCERDTDGDGHCDRHPAWAPR